MSSSEKPKKPMPSVAEINAYLEKSAARTRKRLPLAMSKPEPAPLAALPTQTTKLKVKTSVPKAPLKPENSKRVNSKKSDDWKPFPVSAPEKNKS